MEHLLLKAATTAADQGTFEAVISTASVDRDGDIVEPSAIVKALGKWAELGKLMPLAYSHRDPATGQAVVVGHIDPGSAWADGSEVIAKGWVDQSTDRGAETWRLVKSGTLSFSYGYLVPEGGQTKRPGKKTGYHITDIDLYEVSVVPVGPANNDTRVLSFKSIQEDALALQARILELDEKSRLQLQETMKAVLGIQPEQKETEPAGKEPEPVRPADDPLKETALKSAMSVLTEGAEPPKVVTKEKPKQVPELDPDELRKQSRDLMLTVLIGTEVT